MFTQISDPQLRLETLKSHLQSWLQSDTDTARDWIESHDDFPAEEAAKLYQQLDQNGLSLR